MHIVDPEFLLLSRGGRVRPPLPAHLRAHGAAEEQTRRELSALREALAHEPSHPNRARAMRTLAALIRVP